jgi:hypothetical protein
MTKFEDQLYADLMREHGPALADTRPPAASQRHIASRRVLLASGAGGLAVVATAGALVAAAGSGTPAYALTTNHDGTVTLAVYQASGITQANAKLRQLGDKVVVVPVKAGCPSLGSLRAPAVSPKGQISVQGTKSTVQGAKPTAQESKPTMARGGPVTVNAHGMPAGDILVIGVKNTGRGMGLASTLTSPPAPSCVSLPASRGNAGPESGAVSSGSSGGQVRGSGGGPILHAVHGGGSGPKLSRIG